VKRQYEDEAKRLDPKRHPTVSINRRDDIGMTELLFNRDGIYNDGQPMWEASYWPLLGELKSPPGSVSAIRCKTRNDPERRYGGTGWRCSSTVGLTPEATAVIEIYASQIRHMPAVHKQVNQLFINAKQPSGQ
ncbi:MAG: hypothetical protein Q7U84_09935, partial [Polynucleobacter sp.]|nr:hypothetical protein [Polynucleobacter sp.]